MSQAKHIHEPQTVISKPIHRILTVLTKEPRLEIALPLAMKDLLRLRLKETREQKESLQQRYGMDFRAFKQAWDESRIPNKYSYEVERDYREWEATVTDEATLREMLESMP
ncbi:MAG: hypothetical protein L6435_17875 [Anaerolineae bacterium]|nr:hypothetical protein [Anaerolineae bacterium]